MKTKKITALLLAFAMIFALLPTSVFADASENGWTLENGTLTISSDEGMIDWWENGKATLANDVTKLFIEENVTEIPSGDDQNGNCSPFCVDENGNGCINLATVEIAGKTIVGEKAFYKCSALEKVFLPEVTAIKEYAFWDCSGLRKIVFGSLETIDKNVFYALTDGVEFIFTKPVPSIEDKTFFSMKDSGIWALCFVPADKYGEEAVKSLVVALEAVGWQVDVRCEYLEEEWSTDETTHWHETVDKDCEVKFESAKHSGGLPNADGKVVCEVCGALFIADYGWTLENGTLTISSDEGMTHWWENGKATLAGNVRKLIIEEQVTVIPGLFDSAYNHSPFSNDKESPGCANLTEVEIKGETSIGNLAFYCCENLTKVTAPKATSIGNLTFCGCDKLTDISLPAASSIGDNAFDGCHALKTVSLGNADSIGDYAFQSCYALTNINFTSETTPNVNESAFDIIYNNSPLTISYPCQSKEAYEAALNGKLGGTEGASVTTVPAHIPDESKWEKDGASHWHACACGQEISDKAAHEYGEWATTKEPTCTENGSQERICSICQYKDTGVIDAIGHDFGTEWQKDENNHWHECQRTNCNEKKDEAAHTGGTATIFKKAVCEVCSAEYGDLIPSYGITVSTKNGTVTAPAIAADGDTVEIVCKADKGYHFVSIKADGITFKKVNGKYQFTMPKGDVAITVKFARNYTPPVTDPDEEIDQGITDDPTIDTVLPDGTVVPGKKPPVIDVVDPSTGGTKNPATGDSIFANLF